MMNFYSDLPIEFFVAHRDVKRWLHRLQPHGSQHFNFILKELPEVFGVPPANIIPLDAKVSYVTLQAITRRAAAGIEIAPADAVSRNAIDDWAKKCAHQFPTQAQDIMELYFGRYRPTSPPYYSGPSRAAGFGTGGAGKTAPNPIKPIFTIAFPGTGFYSTGPGGVIWLGYDEALRPEPLKTSAVIAGEIIAVRAWRVRRTFSAQDRMLRSLYQDEVVWRPGQTMTGDVGRDGHGVGVHAYKETSAEATRLFREYVGSYSLVAIYKGDDIIIGRVKLWGDVVEHEHGYRAEFAKIISLDEVAGGMVTLSPPMQNQILVPLREQYGV